MRMNKLFRLRCHAPVVVAIACVGWALEPPPLSAAPPSSETVTQPGLLYSNLPPEEYPEPIWVPAEELLGEGGELRLGRMAPNEARQLERAIATIGRNSESPGGFFEVETAACAVTTVSSWPDGPPQPRDGLLSLLAGAKAVLFGTVSARSSGFLFGSPATLLELELDATSVRAAPFSDASHLYLAYPQASFSLAGTVFCGRHHRSATLPAVGSRILLLAQATPIDREGLVLQPSLKELIVADAEGNLVLPENLQRDDELVGISTLEELQAKVTLGLAKRESKQSSADTSARSGDPSGGQP